MKKFSLTKKITSFALASALVAGVSACGTTTMSMDQELSTSVLSTTKEGEKKWTVLVHLAADNNLYGFGLKDMAEMAYGIDTNDANVIVLFDGAKSGDSGIYEIKKSTVKPKMNAPITSTLVNDGGQIVPANKEINSGDPKLLAKFVGWAAKNYPAEKMGLIIWNHGSGIFRNGVKKVPTNGFAWDDNGTNMNIRDLVPIISPAGKKLEFLDFDACLMAHVEAAYQIKDNVKYLVASEEVEAGDGNDYIGIMQALNKNPNGVDMAKAIVESYEKSYLPGGNQYTGRAEDYTKSATDTSQVFNNVAPAINELASELIKNPAEAKSAWQSAVTYQGDPEPRDLGHFLSLLAKSTKSVELKTKIDSLMSVYKSAVVREVHTKAPSSLSNSTGLVIYLPGPGNSINPKYSNPAEFKFAENKQWFDFLKAFTALK